jgi:hypothetical protein
LNVRICQLDGEMPNLALMNIADFHARQGDHVVVTRSIERELWEPAPDRSYGGAIFAFSQDRLMRFMRAWPDAIVGGTGTPFTHTVADVIGADHEGWDYSGHRDPRDKAKPYQYSIGFTQRGCRLSCKFCVVPKKEGKPRSAFTRRWASRCRASKCRATSGITFASSGSERNAMAYTVQNLPYPAKLKLPKILSATFQDEHRAFHAQAWAPLEGHGIQPCGTGIQVYAQPKNAAEIRRLAQALLRVAARLKNQP